MTLPNRTFSVPVFCGRFSLWGLFLLGSLFVASCGFLGMGEDDEAARTERSDTTASPLLLSYNGSKLFVTGGNVAWNHFARDVGPNPNHPEMDTFSDIFRQVENHHGNTLRLWLHTNGAHTPAWEGSTVVGPGENTIRDLGAILDEAQAHNVGIMICLWSFDMLRHAYGSDVTDRSRALLTEEDKTESYVENALVPMVEAVGDHPALIAWEILNEPAGMSSEFGWDGVRHVPFADIQRFVNRTAGAIHRTDNDALVTNGAWSFSVLTDEPLPAAKRKMTRASALKPGQARVIQQHLSRRPGAKVSKEAARSFYRAYRKSSLSPHNYYRDDRLVDAGGDEQGILDFYSVHYYEWAGTEQSPFHHSVETWGLEKPVVIGEFFLGGSHGGGDNDPDRVYGVAWQDLYLTLYNRGYTGGLGWQWFDWDRNRDGLARNWPRIRDNMQFVYDRHPEDVDVPIPPPS